MSTSRTPRSVSAVLGLHHVSVIAGDPRRNLDFYAGVLGMRLVKRTVNFDDPRTYHLYYGDESGSPGSLLTFFPWPHARRGRPGPGNIALVSLVVPPAALGFWVERLLHHGIKYRGPTRRPDGPDGERVLRFEDPDGLQLEILGHPSAAERPGWGGTPGLPAEHSIRGVHGVTLWEERSDATAEFLVDALGFEPREEVGPVRRFALDDGGPGKVVELREVGEFLQGVEGAGAVHHVAWRVADGDQQLSLREYLAADGRQPTSVIDRQYFRSVYFREPGGVLFEVASDGPGFTVDEPLETLGTRLMLPPRYEAMRERIEAELPELDSPA